MRKTWVMLTEIGKIEGQDFLFPSATFGNLQLSQINKNRKATEWFTGQLKAKWQL